MCVVFRAIPRLWRVKALCSVPFLPLPSHIGVNAGKRVSHWLHQPSNDVIVTSGTAFIWSKRKLCHALLVFRSGCCRSVPDVPFCLVLYVVLMKCCFHLTRFVIERLICCCVLRVKSVTSRLLTVFHVQLVHTVECVRGTARVCSPPWLMRASPTASAARETQLLEKQWFCFGWIWTGQGFSGKRPNTWLHLKSESFLRIGSVDSFVVLCLHVLPNLVIWHFKFVLINDWILHAQGIYPNINIIFK